MTLIIFGVTHRIAWMTADNRYSSPNRIENKARKIFEINASNGHGLIGYAGVGAKPKSDGSLYEMSQWLENLFDGQSFKLEDAFEKIKEASIKNRFGKQSKSLHIFVFVGYLEGKPICTLLTSKPSNPNQYLEIFNPENDIINKHFIQSDYSPIVFKPKPRTMFCGRFGTGAPFISEKELFYVNRIINNLKEDHMAVWRIQAYTSYLIKKSSKYEGNVTVGPESLFAAKYANGGGVHYWNPKALNAPSIILPGLTYGYKNSFFIQSLIDALMPNADDTNDFIKFTEGVLTKDELESKLEIGGKEKAAALEKIFNDYQANPRSCGQKIPNESMM